MWQFINNWIVGFGFDNSYGKVTGYFSHDMKQFVFQQDYFSTLIKQNNWRDDRWSKHNVTQGHHAKVNGQCHVVYDQDHVFGELGNSDGNHSNGTSTVLLNGDVSKINACVSK